MPPVHHDDVGLDLPFSEARHAVERTVDADINPAKLRLYFFGDRAITAANIEMDLALTERGLSAEQQLHGMAVDIIRMKGKVAGAFWLKRHNANLCAA